MLHESPSSKLLEDFVGMWLQLLTWILPLDLLVIVSKSWINFGYWNPDQISLFHLKNKKKYKIQEEEVTQKSIWTWNEHVNTLRTLLSSFSTSLPDIAQLVPEFTSYLQ